MNFKIPNGVRELHRLLFSHRNPVRACLEFTQTYFDTRLDRVTLMTLSQICLRSGLERHLVFYLVEQLKLGGAIPWGHFAEACLRTYSWKDTKKWLLEGAQENAFELGLSQEFLKHCGESQKYKIIAQAEISKKIQTVQEELLNQLEMYTLQGLEELESQVLEQLEARFPHLPGLENKLKKLRTTKAMEVLDLKILQKNQSEQTEKENAFELSPKAALSPEEEKILKVISKELRLVWKKRKFSESMARDFALMHFWFENFDECTHYLSSYQSNLAQFWLYLEVMIKLGRFLQILNLASEAEKQWPDIPDLAWGLGYFRAIALWNLKQKRQALNIMEELARVKPEYRASAVIVDEWTRQLK